MEHLINISQGQIGKTYIAPPIMLKIQLLSVDKDKAKVLVFLTGDYEHIPLTYQVIDPNPADLVEKFSTVVNENSKVDDKFLDIVSEKINTMINETPKEKHKPLTRKRKTMTDSKKSKVSFVLQYLTDHGESSCHEIAEALMLACPSDQTTLEKTKNYVGVILHNLLKKNIISRASRGKYTHKQ